MILLLTIFSSCKESNTNSDFATEENSIEKIQFELPKLQNWKEQYSEKLVNERFNKYSNHGTTIIGVYLNNKTSEQKDSLNFIDFTDYSLFFIRDKEQKWKIEDTDLNRIFNIQLNKAYVKKINPKEAIKKVYSDTTFITSEKPYLLKEYTNNKSIYSAIKLIKPYKYDHDYVVVYVYNLINIKNHLVYGGYYLDFDGAESIEIAQKNNDFIMSEFLNCNK